MSDKPFIAALREADRKVEDARFDLATAQAKRDELAQYCPHPDIARETTRESNWRAVRDEPGIIDEEWVSHYCHLCGKRWVEDHVEIDQGRRRPKQDRRMVW